MMLASLFPRITLTHGQHVDLDWPDFAAKYLRDHDVRARKDGRLFSFAVYHNHPERADANVRAITGIVIDFDNAEGRGNDARCTDDPTLPEHHPENLDGLTYCFYSTHSSTADWPRWRLVLPLDREVSPADWPRVFDGALALLARDGNIDGSCGELSRAYYTPSCEPEHVAARFGGFVEGRVCSVDELLKLTNMQPGAGNVHPLPGATASRHSGRNDALRAVASAMLARGEPFEVVVLELLREDAKHNPPLFTDASEGYRATAEAGAAKFVANIAYSHTSRQVRNGQPAESVTLRDRGAMAFAPPAADEPPLLIMAADMVANIKAPRWLIKGHLEAETMGEVFGEPGVGKSFLALDMAFSVATGRPWHGNKVKQTPVVYICGEGRNGFARRMAAWQRYHEVDLTGVPLTVTRRSIPLSNLQAVAALRQNIEAIVDTLGDVPGLFVIDTLARNFGGGDENSTKDMTAFVELVGLHLLDAYKATVLIVHHSGTVDKTRARGSSALKGAVDAEYIVTRKKDGGLIELASLKMKDAEEPAPVQFTLTKMDVGIVDEDGKPVTSMVPVMAPPVDTSALRASIGTLGKVQNELLDLLVELYSTERAKLAAGGYDTSRCRITVEYWREEAISRGIVSDRKRFFDRKKSLEQGGQIIISGEYAHVRAS